MEMDAERMNIPAFNGLLLAGLGAYLAAGILAGMLYFRALWWNARRLAEGGRAATTIVLMIARFVLLGFLLTLASLRGPMPLLAMALGVFMARFVATRRLREAAP
jgi:F1F0 ATPase subunit 2